MSKLSDANLRQLLRQHPAPTTTDDAVPPDLLKRIQAEIPEQLELPPADLFRKPPPGQRRWPRLRLLAASLIGVVGAGWLYLQVGQPMTRDGGFERAADLSSAETVAPPPPTISPDQASVTEQPAAAAEQTRLRRPASSPSSAPPQQPAKAAALPAPSAVDEATPAPRRLRKQAPTSRAKIGQPSTQRAAAGQPASAAEEASRRSSTEHRDSRQLAEELAKVRQAPAVSGAAASRASAFSTSLAANRVLPSNGLQSPIDPEEASLSTFGLEIGSGSFELLRSYLEAGQMPPGEAVRIEQLLNHFDYGDSRPATGDFALGVEGAPAAFASGTSSFVLRVAITRAAIEGADDGSPPRKTRTRAEVEFNPELVSSYRLLGNESAVAGSTNILARRARTNLDLRRDATASGDLDSAHQMTALWQIELHRPLQPDDQVAIARLRWTSLAGDDRMEIEQPIRGADFASTWTTASPSLRLASLVAEYGELLSRSPRARRPDAEQLANLTAALARQTGDPQAAELARLSRLARALWLQSPTP